MQTARWGAIFALAFTVTAALGLPLAQAQGAGLLWALHGVLMPGSAALLWRILAPEPARAPAASHVGGGLLAEHLSICASPRIAAPGLGFVFYTMLYVAALTLVPGLVAPRFHGLVATLMPLVSIAASVLVGVRLTRRLGAVRTAQIGYGLGALAALCWGLGSGVAQVAAAMALSAALGFAQGASFVAIPELNATAADHARAAGVIAQLGNIGTTLGTPLLLVLIGHWGSAALTVFATPLCLGGIAMHAWLAMRRARA